MIKEMAVKFTLSLEGSKIEIFHALDKLPEKFREAFLDGCYPMDDEDPSEVYGTIDTDTMKELTDIIQAISGKRVYLNLWVEAGAEKENGFKAMLGCKSTGGAHDRDAWWYCDVDGLLAGSKEAISSAVSLLNGLLGYEGEE